MKKLTLLFTASLIPYLSSYALPGSLVGKGAKAVTTTAKDAAKLEKAGVAAKEASVVAKGVQVGAKEGQLIKPFGTVAEAQQSLKTAEAAKDGTAPLYRFYVRALSHSKEFGPFSRQMKTWLGEQMKGLQKVAAALATAKNPEAEKEAIALIEKELSAVTSRSEQLDDIYRKTKEFKKLKNPDEAAAKKFQAYLQEQKSAIDKEFKGGPDYDASFNMQPSDQPLEMRQNTAKLRGQEISEDLKQIQSKTEARMWSFDSARGQFLESNFTHLDDVGKTSDFTMTDMADRILEKMPETFQISSGSQGIR